MVDKENKILLEVCKDCAKHQSHTRHNEQRYLNLYTQVSSLITSECPEFTVVRSEQSRLGAFEVTHSGNQIFSKLKSQIFPEPAKLIERIKNYIQDFQQGNDVKKYAQIKEQVQQPPKRDPIGMRPTQGKFYTTNSLKTLTTQGNNQSSPNLNQQQEQYDTEQDQQQEEQQKEEQPLQQQETEQQEETQQQQKQQQQEALQQEELQQQEEHQEEEPQQLDEPQQFKNNTQEEQEEQPKQQQEQPEQQE